MKRLRGVPGCGVAGAPITVMVRGVVNAAAHRVWITMPVAQIERVVGAILHREKEGKGHDLG